MELQELRQKISEAGFSEEVAAKLDAVFARAVATGALSETDKTTILELIDLDIDAGNLEADAMENMAVMLDSYVSETEALVKSGDAEDDKTAADADREAAKLEAELAQLNAGAVQPVATPVSSWNVPSATIPTLTPPEALAAPTALPKTEV